MDCPSPESILLAIEGGTVDELTDHLDECAPCRELVAELGRLADFPTRAGPIRIGDRVGRYTVLEFLGKGGEGFVVSAFDPSLDRRVALKFARTSSEAQAATLLADARTMAKMTHSNILPVYDVVPYGDGVVIAMEQAEGTLSQYLSKHRCDLKRTLRLLREAGEGVVALHDASILHRDIKPENVLVTKEGVAKVSDFGLSSIDASTARDGGTPRYMAPERVRGEAMTERADQYAFALVCKEMLDGKTPSAAVRTAIERALSADPTNRFATTGAFVATLEEGASPRFRNGLIALAVVLVIPIAAISFRLAQKAPPCASEGAAQLLPTARRDRIAAAFRSTGLPYAEETLTRVDATLERYARALADSEHASCVATEVHHEQSRELMDLRGECYRSRRVAFDTLLTTFESVASDTVRVAVDAANALPRLAACDQARALREKDPLPTNERDRALTLEIRDRVARGRVYRDLLQLDRALAEIEGFHAPHVPTEAARLLLEGTVHSDRDEAERAEPLVAQAIAAAERGHDDALRVWALSYWLYLVGYKLAAFERGMSVAPWVEAGLERTSADNETWASHFGSISLTYFAKGDVVHAKEFAERAVERARKDERPYVVARELNNLAMALDRAHDDEGTIRALTDALEIATRALGPNHPRLTTVESNLAVLSSNIGRSDDAVRFARSALARLEAVQLARSTRASHIHLVLGTEALAHARLDEAKNEVELASSMAEGDRPWNIAELDALRGALAAAEGRLIDATDAYERVLHAFKKAEDFPESQLSAKVGLAEVALLRKENARALEFALEAEAHARTYSPRELQRVRVELALGRALRVTKRDIARGEKLESDARSFYARTGRRPAFL